MFEEEIIKFIKNNPKRIFEVIQRGEFYKKYKKLFNYYIDNKNNFISPVCVTKFDERDIIISTIMSSNIYEKKFIKAHQKIIKDKFKNLENSIL